MGGRRARRLAEGRSARPVSALPPGEAEAAHGVAPDGEPGGVQAALPTAELFAIGPVDLFGLPIAPGRGPGRPRHVPTDASRERVLELHRDGRNLLQIAAAVGITHPTLLRHYPTELESTSQARRRWLGAKETGDA